MKTIVQLLKVIEILKMVKGEFNCEIRLEFDSFTFFHQFKGSVYKNQVEINVYTFYRSDTPVHCENVAKASPVEIAKKSLCKKQELDWLKKRFGDYYIVLTSQGYLPVSPLPDFCIEKQVEEQKCY